MLRISKSKVMDMDMTMETVIMITKMLIKELRITVQVLDVRIA